MQNGEGLPNIDVERVKAYNSNLKQVTDRGIQLNAEMNFSINELTKLCAELSAEYGIQITTENIIQVYMERYSKIENTLRIGEEILNRIKMEESGQVVPSQTPVYENFNTSVDTTNMMSGIQTENVVDTIPQSQPIQNAAPQVNTVPTVPQVPNTVNNVQQQNGQNQQTTIGALPNMFGNNIIEI